MLLQLFQDKKQTPNAFWQRKKTSNAIIWSGFDFFLYKKNRTQPTHNHDKTKKLSTRQIEKMALNNPIGWGRRSVARRQAAGLKSKQITNKAQLLLRPHQKEVEMEKGVVRKQKKFHHDLDEKVWNLFRFVFLFFTWLQPNIFFLIIMKFLRIFLTWNLFAL